MAVKPSAYPEWASVGGTQIVEPSGAKKILGWIVEKPPFQFFNWLFNLSYAWIVWFDFILSPANLQVTITGNTTFAYPVRTYLCNVGGGAFTGTLPAASANKGVRITVKNITYGSATLVNIGRTGSDTIEGGTTDSLAGGEFRTYEADGVSEWTAVA